MNNINKKLVIASKQEYYIVHLLAINTFLPVKLSSKEIEVMASLMSLSGDLVEQDRLCKSARKVVRDRLKLSYGGLSNHIRVLSEKGFIRYDESGKAYIPAVLQPSTPAQSYSFQIELIDERL